ncbi:MAG: hypothetical protein Q3983_06725 [Capnocytophaga sp.]|nr:hypothetical protein [Capnocytophaga sp.]
MDTRKYIYWAFIYFLITIFLGVILRFAYVFHFGFEYRYVVHTHSHMALLGWVYIILTSLIANIFLEEKHKKTFHKIFIFTQISIFGMLFTFPIQGYGVFSIIFSSFFIISSYIFSFFFLKNTKKNKNTTKLGDKKSISIRFIHSAIWFLIISSIGIWAMPVILVKLKLDRFSEWYNSAIYFFLHFQYNGWFMAVLIGLLVQEMEQQIPALKERLKRYFYFFVIGTFGTVCLSWTGLFHQTFLYIIGGISAVLLLISILKISWIYKKEYKKNHLLNIFVIFLIIKTILIFLTSFPSVVHIIFNNKDMVISYLHFTFLGVITFGVLYFLVKQLQIEFPNWTISLYMTAFIATETLITYKGLCVWKKWILIENYYNLLAICSFLFFIPVVVWINKILKIKEYK